MLGDREVKAGDRVMLTFPAEPRSGNVRQPGGSDYRS